MPDAVIIDAVRTPIGRGLDPALVDDVIGGAVTQAGEQSTNLTRNAVLAAGFPEAVPAVTVDRQCGSSQQAAHFAAQGVMAGAYDVAIACGVESMSRVPMGTNLVGADPFGPTVADRYAPGLIPQGVSAELIASKWSLDRERLDALALRSHRNAEQARSEGRFEQEIVAVPVTAEDGTTVRVDSDEGIRSDTTAEQLAALRPAFRAPAWDERFGDLRWRVTAGNSSQISDGAAAVLIMSDTTAARLGMAPRARFHSFAVTGDDPVMMLTGVIPATRRVVERAGLSLDDIGVFEVNEAFASVLAAWQVETGVDLDRVNVNGGAMALGHPLGASGARLMTTLLNAMEQHDQRYGLQTMCEAGGLANATILERV